jgi:hypothetical protein
MFYYKGAKEMGYIQPRVLANYDIVITTYETLGRYRHRLSSETSLFLRLSVVLTEIDICLN